MEFDAVLLPPRRARLTALGLWHDRTINDYLDACVAACPDKTALSALQVEGGAMRRFSYRELAQMADRIAVGLTRLGVGRNDVVACQLPNWWQFTLVYLACSRIGAVMNPLMHIFRERELSFMLAHGRSKLAIVPRRYRGFDFETMLRALQPSLPDLEHVLVVGGEGPDSFEARLAAPAWEREADAAQILARSRPHPDDVMQLIYTSGTTGEPKGVMHTANTALSNLVPYAGRCHQGAQGISRIHRPPRLAAIRSPGTAPHGHLRQRPARDRSIHPPDPKGTICLRCDRMSRPLLPGEAPPSQRTLDAPHCRFTSRGNSTYPRRPRSPPTRFRADHRDLHSLRRPEASRIRPRGPPASSKQALNTAAQYYGL